jgi:hypothetical protein
VSYSWVKRGARKRIPYVNVQGRRVNVMAAVDLHGPQPTLSWAVEAHGGFMAEQFLDLVRQLPRLPDKPHVVVLDNGSLHVNKIVQAALPELRQQRIYLYRLPPYSSAKLNLIEPIFGDIKYHDLVRRRYETLPDLEAAVDAGFSRYDDKLGLKTRPQLRLSA